MSASGRLIWSNFKELNPRQCEVLTHRKSGLFKDMVNYPEHKSLWVSGLSSYPRLYQRLVSVETGKILKITCLSWPSNLPQQTVGRNVGSWKAIYPSLSFRLLDQFISYKMPGRVVQLAARTTGAAGSLSQQTHQEENSPVMQCCGKCIYWLQASQDLLNSCIWDSEVLLGTAKETIKTSSTFEKERFTFTASYKIYNHLHLYWQYI